MFGNTKRTTLAQRTLGALRLTRSFLLLEDDCDVDWEVDLDRGGSLAQQHHPHRRALRGPGGRSRRAGERRLGQTVPAAAVCLSPVGGRARSRLEESDPREVAHNPHWTLGADGGVTLASS